MKPLSFFNYKNYYTPFFGACQYFSQKFFGAALKIGGGEFGFWQQVKGKNFFM